MNLVVYSKFCVPCIYKEKWSNFQRLAREKGHKVKVVRTTYRPLAHAKATKIWGDEYYSTFVAFPTGSNKTINECLDMWQDSAQNKMVKPGRVKSRRKKNDMQRLRKAKRSVRVDRAENPAGEAKTEDSK